MAAKQKLEAKQKQALSPRLYQSLRVLRLSAPQLKELIQRELDENPALDIPEPADLDLKPLRAEDEGPAGIELWRDLAATWRRESSPGRRDPLRPRSGRGDTPFAADRVTLSDHLTLQLNLLKLPESRRKAALAVVGNLDGGGYLREPLREVARAARLPVREIKEALAVVQGFDPPGVGARSLEECLQIQLRQMNATGPAIRIAGQYLPQVARGAVKEIARSLAVPVTAVKQAMLQIRELNPSPGSLFDPEPPAAAVIPDVFVNLEGGRVQVLANQEVLPPLRIGELYRQMSGSAGDTAGADPDAVKYVRERIRKAARLIRDIEKRRATVVKVARSIAEAQRDFLSSGPDHLRPLTLDEVAGALAVHPSTVSRAILGKYMSTPYGIFEFRHFFSAGYSTARGGPLAATAVKTRLRRMIEGEAGPAPLSDQKLAQLLRGDGISLSRRTVAKYREELGIPSSRHRRSMA